PGPRMHGKIAACALGERTVCPPRLHAGSLLREHKSTAGEVFARTRQQKGNLQRENVLPVEILMQTIVVADAVSQEKRRRLRLSGFATAREISRVLARKPHTDPQGLVPAVGDVGERRGEAGPPPPPPIPPRASAQL